MKLEEQRKCFTSEAAWIETETPGVEKKFHVAGNASSMYEVSILRLAPGSHLPKARDGWGVEVVVLEGTWQLPEGLIEENGYARRPPGAVGADSTTTGCTLYVRSAPFAEGDRELVHSPDGQEPWQAGHGNLRVKSVHCGTSFVHWPAGERFIPHQHWGGEEIFVLSGTFRDEHGTYPKGTWLQSPHLSGHDPFVEEETLILVKTGHLPIP